MAAPSWSCREMRRRHRRTVIAGRQLFHPKREATSFLAPSSSSRTGVLPLRGRDARHGPIGPPVYHRPEQLLAESDLENQGHAPPGERRVVVRRTFAVGWPAWGDGGTSAPWRGRPSSGWLARPSRRRRHHRSGARDREHRSPTRTARSRSLPSPVYPVGAASMASIPRRARYDPPGRWQE